MAFTAKILSSRFCHLNIVGCLLKRGCHGHPRTPPSYAPVPGRWGDLVAWSEER